MEINRKFVRLTEGLIHYREAGPVGEGIPVLMMHPSPASSRALEPLLVELGKDRWVIAPDTLGNGDSVPPAVEAPSLDYYADSMLRFVDALNIDKFDVYGSHTGAHIGVELAHLAGDRLAHLVMHGVALLSDEDRQDFLENYAPPQTADAFGSQFNWAWQYIRDQMIFYPHFRKTPEYIRAGGKLDADFLHALTLDILKNLTHYHKTYHAVFRHDLQARLAAVTQPAALLMHEEDPLVDSVPGVREHCKNVAILELVDESPATTARKITEYFNAL